MPTRKTSWARLAVAVVVGLALFIGGLTLVLPGVLKGARPPSVPSVEGRRTHQLKQAFTAERVAWSETGRYSESPAAIGFTVEPGDVYRYVFSADGGAGILADAKRWPELDNEALLAGIPRELLREAGLHGVCDPDASVQAECSITLLAVGNLDADPKLDVWSVATVDRTIDGGVVPAGQPFRHVDDTEP
jgi:hypothetical protein